MLDDPNQPLRPRQAILRPDSDERQQFFAVLVLFVVVAIIIGALYLVQATTNFSNVRDIYTLREERGRIQRDIESLRAESAELNSIPRLLSRAATLGFEPAGPDNIQYIVVEGYVYNQPGATLTPVRQTPTPLVYEDNFSGWVRQQTDWLKHQFDGWAAE